MIPASFCLFLGILLHYCYNRFRFGKFEKLAEHIIQQAEQEAVSLQQKIEIQMKEKKIEQSKEFEIIFQAERKKLNQEKDKLDQKEDKLEQKSALLEKKLAEVEKKQMQQQILQSKLDQDLKTALKNLEQTANFTSEEAKQALFSRLEEELKSDHARFIRRQTELVKTQAEQEASRIIALAIGRMTSTTSSEITASTVGLPSEEMKGRIIGREGRNIRAFEKATGVSLTMDDTPQAVVISAFDPMRRHIAKVALTELVHDGRIHPTSIEEAVEKATGLTEKQIQQFGEDAAYRIGILNFHPEIITLLGKLKFRYSLGQNVLDHSLEVAHLMGIMASELHLDTALAKRIGLLHDIGKAVSHEVQGTHALIGRDLALRYGESELCANGIGCHHFEIDPITVEASLCSAADAISASRPGARIEAVEEYVKRLKQLEKLALTFPGVEKAYALQAGKELRVIALPDQINDDDLTLLGKNLTKKIQQEMDYPGKIKVTLLREKRVVDYAM